MSHESLQRRAAMKIKIFCIGDIVGRPGRRVLAEHLHPFVVENEIDCVIARV
jgi:calcineurin-like phosphoesterase